MTSLRLISSAEAAYRFANTQYGDLNALRTSGFLSDPLLSAGSRSNYTYVIPAATLSANFYEVTATPNVAPWRYYYIDVSGVIRSSLGGPANGTSPPISY